MVANPLDLGPAYAKAGADIVTFHYEALIDDEARKLCIAKIKKAGAKVGMSVKPNTSPTVLFPFLKQLDLVLVMSVEPGKGGQAFMPNALDKIKVLREAIDERHLRTLLEVDGGINAETGKQCVTAGADVLVAGSYLYGHEDFKARVQGLLAL
jgi:ribulose-phosphate 3-epimerase